MSKTERNIKVLFQNTDTCVISPEYYKPLDATWSDIFAHFTIE